MDTTIISQRLPQAEPIGTTDFHQDGVQLPGVDLVPDAPELPERKPGGPLDRFTWMKPAAKELTGAGFKFVFALVGYANDEGRCWPSHARLRLETGLSDSGLRKGQREAIAAGWVVVEQSGQGKGSSKYRLTGADTGWVKPSPEYQLNRHQSNGLNRHQSTSRTLPCSSNPEVNPGPRNSSSEREPEPATVRARSDDVEGRKRKDPEGVKRALPLALEPSITGEPTDSAPPPPAPRPWLNYHPDRPPAAWMPGYVQTMLRRYRKTWLVEWDMEEEKVIRWYSKHWDKFLVDLQRHRANELANVGYAADLRSLGELDAMKPEAPPELVNCQSCGNTTTNPKGPVFRRVGGELECDSCSGCDGITRELVASCQGGPAVNWTP